MASQNDSRSNQNDSNQNNSKSASNSASQGGSRGTPGNEQAARSEEQLDREQKSLIGDTSEDRNLTGSTTYVTLPDQQGDQSEGKSSGQNGRGESFGSSRGDTQR